MSGSDKKEKTPKPIVKTSPNKPKEPQNIKFKGGKEPASRKIIVLEERSKK